MAHAGSPSGIVDEQAEIARLRARISKLETINSALMDRVERATDVQDGPFSMFENALTLEGMVRDRTGQLEEAMGKLATINARIEAAHADADAARARLRDAIESLSDGFALFDADDRLVIYNSAFLKFWPEFANVARDRPTFGEMTELLARSGTTMGSMVSPKRWKQERLARHRNGGTHVQLLADGRWLQINELRTSEGGTVGIYTDITSVKAQDARQRTRELGEQNLALQATLDTLSEGACLFGQDRRLQAWNGELVNMLQLDRDFQARIGTHEAFVRHCIEQCGLDRAQAVEWREGRVPRISTECMLDHRNYVIRSVTLATGGMAFAFEDVTDRIRFQKSLTDTAETLERAVKQRTAELSEANARLAEAKDEAERANRSKTRFLAAASHDILQPLNAARLFVSVLADQQIGESAGELVTQASVALDSVEELLEALFEISRLDAGAIQPRIGPTELDRILSALQIEFAPLAQSQGLEFDVPGTGLCVRTDPQILRRILQNLVSNALRYTAEGQVLVSTRLTGDAVEVSVSDTGPGIAAAEQEVIFEEFRRLDATRHIAGNGLGLAIVRRSCAKLGHEIALQSEAGRGATFTITLPLAKRSVETAQSALGAERKPAAQSGAVLVIDNDPAILAGMRALLQSWGYRVVTASGPEDPAIAEAADGKFAILLADYHLDDDLTGDAAVAQVRARHGAALPAAIITADRSEEIKARLAELDLTVLNKPVKPAQLRALLRQVAKLA